jgi:hypothetical protein
VVDESMGSKSSKLSITAMANSRNTRNLSRRTASDSAGEEVLLVLVLVGRTEGVSTTLLLDNAASRMLLLGLVRLLSEVFCVFDADFIVISEGF